jgi:DNA-directed RNA polymerase specialized sigma24 family protein
MGQPAIKYHDSRRESLAEQIIRALDQMPDRLRRVFIQNHYEEKSPDSIGRSFELTDVEVEALIRKSNELFYRSLRGIRSR